jgi:hypothetical protein
MSLPFLPTPASHERRLLASAVDSRDFIMVPRRLAVGWPISFLSLKIAGFITLLHGMKASHFWRRAYPLHF